MSDPTETQHDPDANPGDSRRDAVIYLAGLDEAGVDDALDSVAAKFKQAFELQAGPKAVFKLEKGNSEEYGLTDTVTYSTRRATVSRAESAGDNRPKPIVDIYSMDYRSTILGSIIDKKPVAHILIIFWIILSNGRRLLFSVGARGKTTAEKWQVRIACGFIITLFLYLLLVVAAAAAGTVEIGQTFSTTNVSNVTRNAGNGQPGATADQPTDAATVDDGVETADGGAVEQDEDPLSSALVRKLLDYSQIFVVWITTIGLLMQFDLKALINKLGLELVSASNYISLGVKKQTVSTQFGALLNHILEKTDVEYRKIHVVGYSFGSVVAIDVLFPNAAPQNLFKNVDSLITIGCPFDFIRTYWPGYFTGRQTHFASNGCWTNVYLAADILGSDFNDTIVERKGFKRSSKKKAYGFQAITSDNGSIRPDHLLVGDDRTLDQYSFFDRIGLIGFKAHTRYWEKDSPGCFNQVVSRLYADDPALA